MRRVTVLSAAALTLAPLGAFAQPAARVVRDQVVVTAALHEETERALPASVEVIEAEEIEARQATSVAELLATATGLHTARLGSPGQVTSLFTRGTESDHTLVLWNGIELNNPYFGGFDFAFLPLDGVERVEVVRGPFSALHGSDALGGAVQIVRARDEGGAVRVEVGERGYLRGGLTAGVKLGKARLDVAGSVRDGDGLVANDDYSSDQIVAALEWQLNGGSELGVLARINESEVGIARSSGLPSPNRRIDWRETQVAIPYKKTLGLWQVEAQWSSVLLESAFRDPDDAFGFTRSDTRSEAARLRTQASYRFATGSWLAVGVEAEQLTVDDSSVFGVNLENARQETRSLFAQSLRRYSRFTLDLGARYDDSDVYGSRLTPRVGLLAPLSDRLSLRASYGEGFRAPSLGELFFQFSGNVALAPEESESLELGLEYTADNWELELVAFDNRLVNLIDFDFNTFTNINVGRARTRGVELRGGAAGRRYQVRANATLLEATDEILNLPLLRRPEERGSLVVTRRQPKVSASATAVYVGPSADVDPVTFTRARNDGYFRLDMAGEWRGGGRLRPYARLENVLDEHYEEALGFPAAPRSWIGGLSLHWQ